MTILSTLPLESVTINDAEYIVLKTAVTNPTQTTFTKHLHLVNPLTKELIEATIDVDTNEFILTLPLNKLNDEPKV
jgi:hypothetical protein